MSDVDDAPLLVDDASIEEVSAAAPPPQPTRPAESAGGLSISAEAREVIDRDFNQVKEKNILERLQSATEQVNQMNYEGALIEFNKVLFYDKNIAEVFAEKAEIYMKMCDFSSAI